VVLTLVAVAVATVAGAPGAGAQAGSSLPGPRSLGSLAWTDGDRHATLAMGVDPAVAVPSARIRVVFTWTFEGPTPLSAGAADEEGDGAAACEDVLGRTYTREITTWLPVIYLGTSEAVADYHIDRRLVGPVVAQTGATSGTGHETITPLRCDGETPIATTVRVYDATYTVPDLEVGRYTLMTPDFGFPRWWDEGGFPIVEAVVAPGGGEATTSTSRPTTTTSTTRPTTTSTTRSTATTTDDPDDDAGDGAGDVEEPTVGATSTTRSTTTTRGTTTTTATTTTTTPTTTTSAPTSTSAPVGAAGGPAADGGGGSGGSGPSAFDEGRRAAGVVAALVAVGGFFLAAGTLGPRGSRRSVRRARRALSAGALAGLAVVGISLFVAAFDGAMALGAGALAVSGLGAALVRARPRRTTLVGPGLSVADARRILSESSAADGRRLDPWC
jgi:hypothetical protein